MTTIYPACFYHEDNGYSVIFPDLNYLATCGDNLQEAMDKAVECLAFYIYELDKDEVLNKASDIKDIDLIEISKTLDMKINKKDSFVSYVSVDVDDYAKKYFEKAVKKTLTIPAYLNKLAIENNINFSQVLQEALKEKLKL